MVTVWQVASGVLLLSNIMVAVLAYHLYDRAVYFGKKYREERRKNINDASKAVMMGIGQGLASEVSDLFGIGNGDKKKVDVSDNEE